MLPISPDAGSSYKYCYILKDKFQALVNTKVLPLCIEKKAMSNMVSLQFGKFQHLLAITVEAMIQISKSEMKLVNLNWDSQQNKGLDPLTTRSSEIM